MNSSPRTVLTARFVGDIAVFDIEGELSINRSPIPTLQDLAKAQLAKGTRKVLFNFEKCDFVDSFGIDQLIATYTSAQNLGGKLKLTAVSPRLLAILMITGIVPGIFQVYPDEAAALESFARPAAPEV